MNVKPSMNILKQVGGFVLVTAIASQAQAIVNPQLTGNVVTDNWTNTQFAAAQGLGTYPNFPGSGNWPAPIKSDGPTATAAELSKPTTNGGGTYPTANSIYFGGFSGSPNAFGGSITVGDTTPVANLANVVLQFKVGEALGYDFYVNGGNEVTPQLTYYVGASPTGTTLSATPILTAQEQAGTFPAPEVGEQPLYINDYLLQWNLTGIANISRFEITWQQVQHSQDYAFRLDQSDTFSVAAVPEPAVVSTLLVTAGLLLLRRREA